MLVNLKEDFLVTGEIETKYHTATHLLNAALKIVVIKMFIKKEVI